ncbi:MAG: hypothetical protein Q8O66_03885 [bacterium]|nr:hypothetical protein [bacterium]
MAEINRAEELTPEEEQTVETNEESSSQELIPEDGEEEKGSESDEKLGQQVEKGEFNYEKRKDEIEARYQERTKKI